MTSSVVLYLLQVVTGWVGECSKVYDDCNSLALIGMSEEAILVFFSRFFQNLCEFIFLCLFVLFVHFYW